MPDDSAHFYLALGHILAAAGLDPVDVLVIRHTTTETGLSSEASANSEALLAYTRRQSLRRSKVPVTPPRWWLVFVAEKSGGLRCRLAAVYENHGEVLLERTESLRFFDLRESEALASLERRLVIEWPRDTINWAKRGTLATTFPVIEIADAQRVPFPGFDDFVLTFAELRDVVADSRYSDWRVALSQVQGVYVITDTGTGKAYVGKADGAEMILGRWSTYARDGHGGNVGMRELAFADPRHPDRYIFSLLRVFGPHVPQSEVERAEAHFKKALDSRTHGLNRN